MGRNLSQRVGSFCLAQSSLSTLEARWKPTLHLQKWCLCHDAITPTTMHVSLLLVGLRISFFEGALPGSGGLGRAVIRLHQTTNHANPGALPFTDPGERVDLTQHNQEDFRSVTAAKGTITIIRTRYNADRATCVHTSWWQTSPICSQLALLDKGPLGSRDSSRVPLTLKLLASTQQGTTHAVKRGPVTSLKSGGEKFSRKRSRGACQQESSTPNKPPFCGAQKRWRPIIDLRKLNQYLSPPHFKMEGLYMLPNVVRQDFFMAKVDLKDAYLTIPVSAEFHCLLAFQNNDGQFLQFQILPFGLCTTPYVFSKTTKPAVQLLRQMGIHIIIYLDDMLLVSPTESSLAQDLSTVLWLFSSLGFVINTLKTTVVLSSEIEFLGFTLNTKTMTVALPTTKMISIQSDVAKVLQNKAICFSDATI